MKGASGQCARVASSRLSVPLALTPKSVCGSLAAQSWEGCAAVWTTSSISPGVLARRSRSIAVGVADVDVRASGSPGTACDEPLGDVGGRRLGAEEAGRACRSRSRSRRSPGRSKLADGLRADQAAGSGDYRYGHRLQPFPRLGPQSKPSVSRNAAHARRPTRAGRPARPAAVRRRPPGGQSNQPRAVAER